MSQSHLAEGSPHGVSASPQINRATRETFPGLSVTQERVLTPPAQAQRHSHDARHEQQLVALAASRYESRLKSEGQRAGGDLSKKQGCPPLFAMSRPVGWANSLKKRPAPD